MADPNDLCTTTYATSALAAGGVTLSTAQTLILPTLITAASKAVIRFLGRPIALASFDEIVTPEGERQDRGEPASAKLAYFPVQSLSRVATGRATAITIANLDQVTNQVATVAFVVAGDVEYPGLSYSGITLSRTASGVVTSNTLTFSANPTVQALASAVSILGGGWSATAVSSLGLWPTTELVGAREPKGAFSPGVGLDVFRDQAGSYDVDRATGILRVYGDFGLAGVWGFGGFGESLGLSWDGVGGWGSGALGGPQYRVSYTAGWATIPEGLQQACAELVKSAFERLATDSVVQSESAKDYSYTVRDAWLALPDWALQVLHFYKDWRV